MNYDRDNLQQYFLDAEKKKKTLGVEIENLLLDEHYRWVPYEVLRGILQECLEDGWEPVWVDGMLLGAVKGDWAVSLEPGSQFELSLSPQKKLRGIEKQYTAFMNEMLPRMHERGVKLYAIGYQPLSSLEDITIIEKQRYKWMYDHFASLGGVGHHMMKGTAATQVSIDFSSEEDFARKLRLAGLLSPYLSLLFDNSALREGKPMSGRLWRREIWKGTDPDRTGDIPGSLAPGFTYDKLIDEVLGATPILYQKEGELYHANGKLAKDLIGSTVPREDWEHLLSMFFFDTRVKTYLEIRMMDSLPLEHLLSAAGMVKGLLYSKKSLKKATELLADEREKEDILPRLLAEGLTGQTKEVLRELVRIAGEGLGEEAEHLAGAVVLIETEKNLSDSIKDYFETEGLAALKRREVRIASL